MRLPWLAAFAVALSVAGSPQAKELKVGDPAPKLEVKEFVKGDPVTSLEKGRIYVIGFWATWCGPCRAAIPHLSELQKKHQDVVFIGVNVWDRDPKAVKPFVEEMGDKMAYRVAMDDVPPGAGITGKMAKSWMLAANQNGIPTAFIINKNLQIAWICHPMHIDKPLEQVVAGTFDLVAAEAEAKKEAEQKSKLQELAKKVDEAQKSGKIKEVLQLAKELDELTEGKNPGIVHFLAKAYFDNGDAAKAVETEKRVLWLVKCTLGESNPQIKEALEKYKKEIEKK